MGRAMVLVALVVGLMVTGIAGAAPHRELRVPAPVSIPPSPSGTVIVERGDHLWKISERHLDEHAPQNPVAPYWLEVIEVNTPSLRSGDPDLIYPGETITLPEITGQR